MSEHTTSSSLKTYFIIWLALLAATALTTFAAGVDLGRFNAAVALTIASLKATLVALFFMHIRGASERMTKLVVISALFFLLILLGLSMSDYATRSWS
jgi:cytochrome c oxidase subunit IV